jgi:menaquinone-specific isochorismate synthase
MVLSSQQLETAASFQRLGSSDLCLADRLKLIRARLNDRMPALPMLFSREVSPIHVLGWLHSQPELPRVYWSSRENDFEIAGAGTVVTLDSRDHGVDPIGFIKSVEQIIEACGEQAPFFVGGFRFDRNRGVGRQWKSFPAAWFVVPDSALVRIGSKYFHVVATPVAEDTTAEQLQDFCEQAKQTYSPCIGPVGAFSTEIGARTDTPDVRQWRDNVTLCLSSIGSNEVRKIVMARRTDFKLSDEVDPIALYSSLASETGRCFGFMVEFDHGGAFLGASPERLFRLSGNTLITEAVAGTSSRTNACEASASAITDKEVREHGLVEEFALEAMRILCDDAQVTEPRSPLILEHLAHFRSEIRGRLRDKVGIADVVSQLHPTPAVGGYPREKALQIIRQIEPFDRGWYAAPFGVMTQGFADFSVSIRSAVVSSTGLSLYSGAGIVLGSDPDNEWDELERKIAPHLRILGGVSA